MQLVLVRFLHYQTLQAAESANSNLYGGEKPAIHTYGGGVNGVAAFRKEADRQSICREK